MPSRISHLALAAAGLAAIAAAGCSQGRKTPEKTTVNVVNAVPTASSIDFLREQSLESSLSFRATSGPMTFDEDQYDFNVATTPPGSAPELLDTFSKEVLHGTDYLFVLTTKAGEVTHLVFESAPFASTTQTEVRAVHAASSQPAMDVYLTAPGEDVSTGTPLAGLEFEQGSTPTGVDPGDYVLTLTQAGNPAEVLFTSTTLTLAAGNTDTFVIVDGTGDGLVPFSVVIAGSAPAVVIDKDTPAGLEVVNAAADGAARDVYLDDDFTAPFLSALSSPGVSAPTIITPGSRKLTVTPAGNPGVVEAEQTFTAARGVRYTEIAAGDPGGLAMLEVQDDPRPIMEEARVRFMNAATLFTALDVFVVPTGTDITALTPLYTMAVPAITPRTAIPPGEYDLVLRDPTTSTIVAGPEPLTLTEGLFTILATNGSTPGTVDVVHLQGFD